MRRRKRRRGCTGEYRRGDEAISAASSTKATRETRRRRASCVVSAAPICVQEAASTALAGTAVKAVGHAGVEAADEAGSDFRLSAGARAARYVRCSAVPPRERWRRRLGAPMGLTSRQARQLADGDAAGRHRRAGTERAEAVTRWASNASAASSSGARARALVPPHRVSISRVSVRSSYQCIASRVPATVGRSKPRTGAKSVNSYGGAEDLSPAAAIGAAGRCRGAA